MPALPRVVPAGPADRDAAILHPAALPAGAEAAALQALVADPPATLLVASDLHLSSGRDPVSGRFDRIENFFADEAFGRWLDHYRPAAEEGAVLVLNGDTVDFLRVVATPITAPEMAAWRAWLEMLGVRMTAAELSESIDEKERRYGLGTEDFKCVWKLGQIASGHREFFAGLARWLRAGGRILVVKGNHDVELHWPLVRLALRRMLWAAPDGAGPGAVVFCDDFVWLANVHLEHGHQYESTTAVEGPPTLTVKQGVREVETIRLPSGSFVNRYLINSAEDIYPFLDNARPLKRSIRLILRGYPVRSLKLVLPAYHLIRKSWRISGGSFANSVLTLVNILAPVLSVLLVLALLNLDWVRNALRGMGQYRYLLSIAGAALPYLLSALAERFPRGRGRVLEDEYADHVYHGLLKRPDRPAAALLYGVVGHTHDQDCQLVPAREGAPAVMYLNTGTWTPLFIDDRPDLMGRAFRPFLRFTRADGGEYRHQYLQWNDERGGADPIEILGPVRRSGWEGVELIRAPEPPQPAEPGNAQPAVGP